MYDHLIGAGLVVWGGSFLLVVALAAVLGRARRDDEQLEQRLTLESDAPLTPEDLQAVGVLLHHVAHQAGEELYQQILAQVAEDAADDEADAFIDEVLGGASDA